MNRGRTEQEEARIMRLPLYAFLVLLFTDEETKELNQSSGQEFMPELRQHFFEPWLMSQPTIRQCMGKDADVSQENVKEESMRECESAQYAERWYNGEREEAKFLHGASGLSSRERQRQKPAGHSDFLTLEASPIKKDAGQVSTGSECSNQKQSVWIA